MMTKTTRMTRQKQLILEVLRSTTCHPTADWIYEQARKTLPSLSLGTVYRNLGVLRDMGEIMELNYGSTYSRFDGNPKNHYHFMCRHCGQVYDLDLPVQTEINRLAIEITKFQVDDHRMEFYGLCSGCLATAGEERPAN